MPSSAVITADTGPAVQSTAKVYTNILAFNFDAVKRVLTLQQGSHFIDFDMVGVTAISFAVSGADLTCTMS